MESYFGSYVSCIKMGKQPIIPPLMDDQRREEMRRYRQLAISLESRRKQKRPSTDSGVMISSVEGTASSKNTESVKPHELAECDLPITDLDESECNVSSVCERRNSYTLEAPSPVLLAFIQSLQNKRCQDDDKLPEIFTNKQSEINELISTPHSDDESMVENLKTDTSNTKSSKRKLWDIETPKSSGNSRKPLSLPDSHYNSPNVVKRSYESDDCVSYNSRLNTVDYEYVDKLESRNTNCEVHSTPNKYVNDSFNKDFCLLDNTNTSRDTDACRESIFSDCSSVSLNKFIPSDKKSPESHEAEYEAFLYFKEQLKLKHRKQLELLIQQQQQEHDLLNEQFQKLSRAPSYPKTSPVPTPVHAFSQHTYTKKPSPGKRKSPIVLDSPSVLPIPTPPPKLHHDKQYKAASKINAGVRGYLTRRLFKTSRVTLLVQTIKDCLVTAMSLQNEPNLGLSELDLQNRLLQQLTTACNELNDIFSLPTKQRMAIIAEDREKKKREFKRTQTPLPLSEATRRSLQRKLTTSAPSGERKQPRKRCRSVSSIQSDSNSCNNLPSQRRPLSSSSFSHKYSVPQANRKPWR